MNRTNKKLKKSDFPLPYVFRLIITATGQTKTMSKFYFQAGAGGGLVESASYDLGIRPLLKINGVPHYRTRN